MVMDEKDTLIIGFKDRIGPEQIMAMRTAFADALPNVRVALVEDVAAMAVVKHD